MVKTWPENEKCTVAELGVGIAYKIGSEEQSRAEQTDSRFVANCVNGFGTGCIFKF